MAISYRQMEPNADIRASQLQHYGYGIGLVYPNKKLWYVDSVRVAANLGGADNQYNGTDALAPFATIAYAVTQAGLDDVIVVMPAHTESVSAADAWLWAQNGIRVVGLGTETTRPTITFDTATTATILMDKAGLVLDDLRFVVGIDSLALMLNMSAAGCVIQNCEFIQDDSSLQSLLGITLSAATAVRCKILNCNFESITAGANSAIKIDAALNDLVVSNCRVFGDFADGCIHNPTGNIATNLHIADCALTNTQTGDHSIELVSACTGNLIRNFYNNDMTQATGVDPGSCRSFECYHDDAVDVSGILAPAGT